MRFEVSHPSASAASRNIELRPSGWHLGWLPAWIALVAVARHGAARRPPDLPATGQRPLLRLRHLGAHLVDWGPPVEGVMTRLPPSVRGRRLAVTERPNPMVGNSACSPVGLLGGAARTLQAGALVAAGLTMAVLASRFMPGGRGGVAGSASVVEPASLDPARRGHRR